MGESESWVSSKYWGSCPPAVDWARCAQTTEQIPRLKRQNRTHRERPHKQAEGNQIKQTTSSRSTTTTARSPQFRPKKQVAATLPFHEEKRPDSRKPEQARSDHSVKAQQPDFSPPPQHHHLPLQIPLPSHATVRATEPSAPRRPPRSPLRQPGACLGRLVAGRSAAARRWGSVVVSEHRLDLLLQLAHPLARGRRFFGLLLLRFFLQPADVRRSVC